MNAAIHAVGRRKTSVARLYLKEGKGAIIVNKKNVKDYFVPEMLHDIVYQPLDVLDIRANFDITVNVTGGGVKGQAECIRLAITRALCEYDATYKPTLRQHDFVTRDPRMVERKKYGRKKARKKFQFSKR